MKTSLIITLLSIVAFNSYAQVIDKKASEENLVIHSNQGLIELKSPSVCKQLITEAGAISVNCETQCKQTVDKQGKVLIQC